MDKITKRLAEYIWLGGDYELRSKSRVLTIDGSLSIYKIPDWDYDGSSTKQASDTESEVIIKPRAIFKDPFRGGNNILVLCATYRPDGTPLSNNHRDWASAIFDKNESEEPWYGLEQEYFLCDMHTKLPLGFPKSGDEPNPQGQYYCSVGALNAFGRKFAEEHCAACINAGINISGINAEVAPGQWEYQVGPCVGISAADQLWVARYILERVSEKYGVYVNIQPKPLTGNWNGSGCHTNFSTKKMREANGIVEIYKAVELLGKNHNEHMKVYGSGNEERLTGKHETSSFYKFSYGVANRSTSVRIGNKTVKDGCGYFEDRRPSSNMDPYLVTAKIMETVATPSLKFRS